MGFLDRLGGGGAVGPTAKDIHSEKEQEASTSAAARHDFLPDTSNAFNTAPSSRLYDPYEGISAAIGGKKQAFALPDKVEFVFEEEAAVRRRGWTENLQFYTGLGYISGASVGVSAGGYNFLRKYPEYSKEPLKLKTNRLLNSAGALARPFGNSCGILGLFFAGLESYLANQLDSRFPDAAVTIMAGAVSAGLFRSPRGPRQAAVAAGVGAVGGAGLAFLRTMIPSL